MTFSRTRSKPPDARVSEAVRESFASGADGTRLYVRQKLGRSPLTAIFCDGICCDGYIWKYLWDDLAPLANLCHWHYRGHGRSEAPRDPARIDVPSHAVDLDQVRRHVGDGPVVLVGHSMGCQVVLEAYRSRSENVAGLVLICGSSGRVTHTFHGTEILARLLPKLVQMTETHQALMRGIWSRIPVKTALKVALATGEVDKNLLEPTDLLPYLEHATHMDFLLFLRMLLACGEYSADEFLPSIDVASLVIAGESDTFTPHALAEKMAHTLPNSELLMVRKGTHVAPLEHRELVANRVGDFLTKRAMALTLGR
jgi:pimeloyl-ACP methyl ester carboxylesterase